jgi:hypothetical protein
MAEKWRSVVGHEGWYEVSSLGRVHSITRTVDVANGYRGVTSKTISGKLLSGKADKKGYPRVDIYSNGKRRPVYIHRLVAEAFLAAISGKTHVNHKDGNTTNNRATNLEWMTQQENNEHSRKTGLFPFGSRHGHAKLSESSIPTIRKRIKNGEPLLRIAKSLGVSRHAISAIRDRKTWSHVND